MSGKFGHDNFEDFLIWMIELSSVSNMKKCVSDFENMHLDEQKFGPTGEVYKVENKPGCLIAEMHPSQYESKKIELSFDQDIYSDLKYHQMNTFGNFISRKEEKSLLIILKHRIGQLMSSLGRISKQEYYSNFPNYSIALNDLLSLLGTAFDERKFSGSEGDNSPQKQNKEPIQSKEIEKTKKIYGGAFQKRKKFEERFKEEWPDIVKVVRKVIKDKPLSDYITQGINASADLYEPVSRLYTNMSKHTLRKWLDREIKSGKLEADLKKLTTD